MILLHNSPFDAKEAYTSHHASFRLPHPTCDIAELIHHACAALARIFRLVGPISDSAALSIVW
jgi:methyl coenzyme M reductase subunit C-like uncharacterized protein (methanogenesis marker protein 7)